MKVILYLVIGWCVAGTDPSCDPSETQYVYSASFDTMAECKPHEHADGTLQCISNRKEEQGAQGTDHF